jgi:hypothetical protein
MDQPNVFDVIEEANNVLLKAGLPFYGELVAALAALAKKVPFCTEQDEAARLVARVQAAGGVVPLTSEEIEKRTQYEVTWGPSYVEDGTRMVGIGLFTEDNGFDLEDIERIEKLDVGQEIVLDADVTVRRTK